MIDDMDGKYKSASDAYEAGALLLADTLIEKERIIAEMKMVMWIYEKAAAMSPDPPVLLTLEAARRRVLELL